MAPSAMPTGWVTATRAIANRITPVPSLNRASASTTVASRPGAFIRLNSSMTATGSVAETIAPSRNPSARSSPVDVDPTIATTPR